MLLELNMFCKTQWWGRGQVCPNQVVYLMMNVVYPQFEEKSNE